MSMLTSKKITEITNETRCQGMWLGKMRITLRPFPSKHCAIGTDGFFIVKHQRNKYLTCIKFRKGGKLFFLNILGKTWYYTKISAHVSQKLSTFALLSLSSCRIPTFGYQTWHLGFQTKHSQWKVRNMVIFLFKLFLFSKQSYSFVFIM